MKKSIFNNSAKFSTKVPSIFLLIFLGLVIRLLFVPHPGFEADIAYWKWWGEAASHGPANALNTTSINYPPFFIFVLGAIWKIYTLVSHNISPEQLYQTNNFLFLLIVKLPAILSDLVIAYCLYWLVKKVMSPLRPPALSWQDRRSEASNKASAYSLPLLSAGLYLFNPVTIYDSAVWGQTDSIAAAISIISLITLLEHKVWLTFVIAIIALETKVQTVIFLPFLFLITLRWFGLKKLLESLSVSAITFLVINLPYILSGLMVRAMGLIFESASYFPLASLNAYNFWWLITGGNGFYVADSTLFGNAFTYKFLGMSAFMVIYSLLALYLWQKTKISNNQFTPPKSIDEGGRFDQFKSATLTYQPSNHQTFESCFAGKPYSHLYSISLVFSVASFAFFMLPTQIHERYIFSIFVFLPIWICFNIFNSQSIKKNYSLIYYCLLTISIFLNLHLVLVMNYPNNGFPLLSLLNKPETYIPVTLFLSYLNVFLFLFLLVIIFRKLSKKILWFTFWLYISFIFLQLAASFLNRQQIDISLTKLKPSYIKQDWGNLQINKTVDKRLLSGSYVWYKEGLGTHANSQIDYHLNQEFSTFTVDAGIDTEANDSASVVFIILGDDRELYKSPVVKKWNWPIHIKVSVIKVDKLTLLVTDGGDSKNGDHADWLNPMLYK